MKTIALFLASIAFLTYTSSLCMEDQPLITRLRASTPLREMLARRNPNFEPLLAKENREENLALIQSIGTNNIKTKLFAALTGALVLNTAKDAAFMAIWGSNQQTPLTDLIPPSHLMPLTPCHQECWTSGCCFADCSFGPSCISSCDLVCGDTPPTTFFQLATLNSALFAINLSSALVTGLIACYNSCQRSRSEEKLQKLIRQLDGLTEGDDFPILQTADEPTETINTLLDHYLTQDMEREDQTLIQKEREKNIELIQSLGAYKTGAKMWALLALAFGVNAAKDLVLQQLWGSDARYPLTPLNPPSDMQAVHNCHQICVGTGCCTNNCAPFNCSMNCTNQFICDSDATSVLNSFGKTALGTSIVNAAGFLTSCFGVWHCWKNGNQSKQKLHKLIKKLDKLAADTQEDEDKR